MSKHEAYSKTWGYEIALYRGDDLVDTGTIKEIAERRGVQKRTIYWMTMPTAERRKDKFKNQNKVLRAVRV